MWDRRIGRVRMGFAIFNPSVEGIELEKLRGKLGGNILWRGFEHVVILTYFQSPPLGTGKTGVRLKTTTPWVCTARLEILGYGAWTPGTRGRVWSSQWGDLGLREGTGEESSSNGGITQQTRPPSEGLASNICQGPRKPMSYCADIDTEASFLLFLSSYCHPGLKESKIQPQGAQWVKVG